MSTYLFTICGVKIYPRALSCFETEVFRGAQEMALRDRQKNPGGISARPIHLGEHETLERNRQLPLTQASVVPLDWT